MVERLKETDDVLAQHHPDAGLRVRLGMRDCEGYVVDNSRNDNGGNGFPIEQPTILLDEPADEFRRPSEPPRQLPPAIVERRIGPHHQ